MNKKVSFTWELKGAGWKWEATHYQGNGIFFGKVTSPYVSYGELGTWYYWEVKQNGGVLTKGSQADIDKLLDTKQTKKAMGFQQRLLGEDLSGSKLVKDTIDKTRRMGGF